MRVVKLIHIMPSFIPMVVGIFYLSDDRRVLYRSVGATEPVSEQMFEDMFHTSIRHPNGTQVGPIDGDLYLEALQYNISGSAARATAPLEE